MRFAGSVPLFLLSALVGCSSEEAKLPVVSQSTAFPPHQQEAAIAIANHLRVANENPSKFHARVEVEQDGVLCFHLWHEEAFAYKYRNALGNPGGKSRDVRYDPATRKILSSLLWK